MGTNYYAVIGGHKCSECGEVHKEERLHIGKSSAGWCFSLAVYRAEYDDPTHPKDWGEWLAMLKRPDVVIANEYGDTVALEEFVKTVTERSWLGDGGLLRHDPHERYGNTYGPGEGTYDYCKPGFS